MNAPADSVRLHLSPKHRKLFESCVEQFEQAWHQKPFPELADFLPEATDGRLAVLAELVAIDREFRLLHNAPLEHSAYLQRYPELGRLADNSAEPPPEQSSFETDVSRITSIFSSPIKRFRGGLGEVLIVYDQQLGRRVAIKQLQTRWKGNNRATRAFRQEAELTCRLEHPGVVPVHGVGTTPDGRPCYTMRYIEGETLAKRIATLRSAHSDFNSVCRPLLSSFITVCNTIAFAHSRGIVHRDLKPENVMLAAFGETLVIDWGLAVDIAQIGAKDAAGVSNTQFTVEGDFHHSSLGELDSTNVESSGLTHRSSTTVDGEIMGTPAYMSPEQAVGENDSAGTAIDIFGLGAILYVILTGVPPYQSENAAQSLKLAAKYLWRTPKERDRSIPVGLDAICRRAMSRHPADRYATAEQLAYEVDNWLCGEPLETMPDPWNRRLSRFLRKRRTLAGMLASGMAVLAVVVPLLVTIVSRERLQKRTADRIAAVRAESAEQVTQYLAKIFRELDPIRRDEPGAFGPESLDGQQTFRRMLETGYELVKNELHEQPRLRSHLLRSIGDSFRALAEYDRAHTTLQESLALSQQIFGDLAEETLECEYALGMLDYDRGNYIEAEKRLRRVIVGRQQLSPPRPLQVADAQCQLAWLLFYQPLGLAHPQFSPSAVEESIQLFCQAIEIRRELLPANDRSLGLAYAGLAAVQSCSVAHISQAAISSATAIEIFNDSASESILGNTLIDYHRAERYRAQGNGPEAEKLYLKLSDSIAQRLGTKHPAYLIHLWNMAGHYRKFGESTKAQQKVEEVRSLAAQIPGFRSTPAHIDGLIQYAELLLVHDIAKCREVILEAIAFARERGEENETNLDRLYRLRTTAMLNSQ